MGKAANSCCKASDATDVAKKTAEAPEGKKTDAAVEEVKDKVEEAAADAKADAPADVPAAAEAAGEAAAE